MDDYFRIAAYSVCGGAAFIAGAATCAAGCVTLTGLGITSSSALIAAPVFAAVGAAYGVCIWYRENWTVPGLSAQRQDQPVEKKEDIKIAGAAIFGALSSTAIGVGLLSVFVKPVTENESVLAASTAIAIGGVLGRLIWSAISQSRPNIEKPATQLRHYTP